MWHEPAAFACAPDSPALELDWLCASVCGEGVVLDAFLLGVVGHGIKVFGIKSVVRTRMMTVGSDNVEISADSSRVGPMQWMTKPVHLSQLYSHRRVSPPPRAQATSTECQLTVLCLS